MELLPASPHQLCWNNEQEIDVWKATQVLKALQPHIVL